MLCHLAVWNHLMAILARFRLATSWASSLKPRGEHKGHGTLLLLLLLARLCAFPSEHLVLINLGRKFFPWDSLGQGFALGFPGLFAYPFSQMPQTEVLSTMALCQRRPGVSG